MKALLRRRSPYALAAAALIVTPLAVSACSSASSAGVGATAATSSGGSSTAAGAPVSIGAYIEQTGEDGEIDSPAAPVAAAWVKWVNASGGINGHPVEIDLFDTGTTSATAIASATKLASDSSLVATLLISSTEEGVVAPVFAKAQIPVFGVGYQDTVWGALPNFFTAEVELPEVVEANNLAAKVTGAKVVGVDVCAETPACAEAGPLFQSTAEALGMKYGGLVKTAADAPSYTADCLQLMSSKVDFIQLATASQPGLRLASNCASQGYTGQFGLSGTSVVENDMANYLNLNLAGDLSAFPWWSTAQPVQTFLSAMKAGNVSPSVYESEAGISAWTELEVFRAAMETQLKPSTTAVTRQMVLDGFGSLKNTNLGGLLANSVSFTAGKPSAHLKCVFVYQVKDGKFTSPSGNLKPSCLS